jgi:hypothetical protein
MGMDQLLATLWCNGLFSFESFFGDLIGTIDEPAGYR